MATFYDTTYPSEVEYDEDNQQIIDSIRILIGDRKKVAFDKYSAEGFSSRVTSSGTTYVFAEKSWPLRVSSSFGPHETLGNPSVSNYQYVTFDDSSPLSDSTFEIVYETFLFSDYEIYQSYETSIELLVERSLPRNKVTGNLAYLQAAVLLLDGLVTNNLPEYIKVTDGRTQYDSGSQAQVLTGKLNSLRNDLAQAMLQTRHHAALSLDIIRLE